MTELHINMLGGLKIAGLADTSITRKVKAVAAYLALQRGKPQSREKLATLFWETSPEEQARTNLRQCLSTLRKHFGPSLVADSEDIHLDPSAVHTDVEQFEQQVSNGDFDALMAAVEIYKGDLLDGFNVKENAFETWIRTERERYRTLMVDALGKLIEQFEDARDASAAATHSLQLLRLDPLNENIHRSLMRAYAAQGRHDSAMKQFEICCDTLASELGVGPTAETLSLFEDIRRKRSSGSIDKPVSKAVPDQPDTLSLPDKPSVAVLAFENRSGDPEQDYFAEGLTENIIAGLTRFRGLFVAAFSSSIAAREQTLSLPQAVQHIGVRHVIEGSVRKVGNRVRVTIQLSDAVGGQRIWAEQYDREVHDIFAVQDEITSIIVATLVGRIEDADHHRAERKTAQDMSAYDCWLRGRYCLNSYTKDDLLQSRMFFERALELDPSYARAYADLARSHLYEYEANWSEDPLLAIDRCYQMARKAVELDDADSTAHYALAWAYAAKRRIELAMAHIDKSLRLNPNDYHSLCAKSYFLAVSGKADEGVSCSNEAMRLNPFSTDACQFAIGLCEFGAKNYENAIRAFGAVKSFVPMKRSAYLAACFAHLGRDEQARNEAAEVLQLAETEVFEHLDTDPERWRAYWSKWYFFQTNEELEHFLLGIRKAGLPA